MKEQQELPIKLGARRVDGELCNEANNLLVRARNLLSHPAYWHGTPEHHEKRQALSLKITEYLNSRSGFETIQETSLQDRALVLAQKLGNMNTSTAIAILRHAQSKVSSYSTLLECMVRSLQTRRKP